MTRQTAAIKAQESRAWLGMAPRSSGGVRARQSHRAAVKSAPESKAADGDRSALDDDRQRRRYEGRRKMNQPPRPSRVRLPLIYPSDTTQKTDLHNG
jgi:hypothetical protein